MSFYSILMCFRVLNKHSGGNIKKSWHLLHLTGQLKSTTKRLGCQLSRVAGKAVRPIRVVLAKIGGLIPGQQKGTGPKPVTSSQIICKKGEVYQRDTDKQKWVCLKRLVPLLYKYSLLWTKPRLLQCDVIIQVSELPSGKVGDEFEAFIRVALGLHVSNQGLEMSNTAEVSNQYSDDRRYCWQCRRNDHLRQFKQ